MKPNSTFFVIVPAILSLPVFAQTIEYSKGIIPYRETDNTIIVGTYGNTLHVVKEEAGGNKELLLYGQDLQLTGKKSLQQKPEGFGDVQIIAYSNFYYLLLTAQSPKKLRILKINASGEFEDKTKQLEQQLARHFVDSSIRGSFRKVKDKIFLITNRYDRSKKKILLNVLSFDSLFSYNNQHLLITDINNKEDIINDIVFADTTLIYILKSFREYSDRHGEVEIVKYDLNTGSDKRIVFSGPEEFFYGQRLKYNYADSALLFFAVVCNREAKELVDNDFKCYYAKLDNELRETAPPETISIRPGRKERIMVLLPDYGSSVLDANDFLYYPDFGPSLIERVFYYGDGPPLLKAGSYAYSLEQKPETLWTGQNRVNINRKRVDADMRIIWTDKRRGDKTVLLKSKKGKLKREFFNYFLLRSDSKLTLLYTTGFSLFRNGISYQFLNNGNASEDEYLRVNERYDYMMASAKQIGDHSLVVPYVSKDKLGLAKISF